MALPLDESIERHAEGHAGGANTCGCNIGVAVVRAIGSIVARAIDKPRHVVISVVVRKIDEVRHITIRVVVRRIDKVRHVIIRDGNRPADTVSEVEQVVVGVAAVAVGGNAVFAEKETMAKPGERGMRVDIDGADVIGHRGVHQGLHGSCARRNSRRAGSTMRGDSRGNASVGSAAVTTVEHPLALIAPRASGGHVVRSSANEASSLMSTNVTSSATATAAAATAATGSTVAAATAAPAVVGGVASSDTGSHRGAMTPVTMLTRLPDWGSCIASSKIAVTPTVTRCQPALVVVDNLLGEDIDVELRPGHVELRLVDLGVARILEGQGGEEVVQLGGLVVRFAEGFKFPL